MAIPWLLTHKHRNQVSRSKFSAKTGHHRFVIISNWDNMLSLGLGRRTFSAIDDQLDDEGRGNHDVGASDKSVFSIFSL